MKNPNSSRLKTSDGLIPSKKDGTRLMPSFNGSSDLMDLRRQFCCVLNSGWSIHATALRGWDYNYEMRGPDSGLVHISEMIGGDITSKETSRFEQTDENRTFPNRSYSCWLRVNKFRNK